MDPEVRIELDGLLALFSRFILAAQVREGPSSKRVAFGSGLDRDALFEQLDGILHLPFAQALASLFPQFARSLVVWPAAAPISGTTRV